MADQTVNGVMPIYMNSALTVNNSSNSINLNKLSSLVPTVNALNNVVSAMYGVTVKWFRATPVDRSVDVIFHEYTLHNVTDCGFDLNVIYDDTGYDEAALQYNMMGIQYQIPMTVNIAVDVWNAATNNDGTIPQKRDIVYFPQSNKLYQVVSMNPVKTVASQITSYKCNLAIYKQERSVSLNTDLAETIDNYTESVEKKFGNDINDDIMDIIADKQTSAFNSTHIMDKHKKLHFDLNNNYIINDELYSDGHFISRNYYKNEKRFVKLVEYLNSNDIINKDDGRFYSIIFRLRDNNIESVKLSNPVKTKKYTTYNCNKRLDAKNVNIVKGNINIFGLYNKTKNNIQIDNNILSNYPDSWNNIGNFDVNMNDYNLLCAKNDNKTIFSIDIINRSLIIKINSKVYNIAFDNNLEENIWYNISLNISKNANVRIFELGSEIKDIGYYECDIDNWKDLDIKDYSILGSDIDLRNIRLFNQCINDKDKQLINLISQFSDDESKMIIADNVDEFEHNSFYGTQR